MREKGLECDGRAGAHGLIALTREEEWGTAAQLADDIALTGIAHTPYRWGAGVGWCQWLVPLIGAIGWCHWLVPMVGANGWC